MGRGDDSTRRAAWIAGWFGLVGVLVTAAVTVATQRDGDRPEAVPTATVTRILPGEAGTPAATPAGDEAAWQVAWRGPAQITHGGVDFDQAPPAKTEAMSASTDLRLKGFTPVNLATLTGAYAIWDSAAEPSAADCEERLRVHEVSGYVGLRDGRAVCLRTGEDQGDTLAFVRLTSTADAADRGVQVSCVIWTHVAGPA